MQTSDTIQQNIAFKSEEAPLLSSAIAAHLTGQRHAAAPLVALCRWTATAVQFSPTI